MCRIMEHFVHDQVIIFSIVCFAIKVTNRANNLITIYYSGSHKMKGTAHVLFRVATCHRGSYACNRCVALITGAVMLVTGA